jgi:hypothetical protein
LRHKFVGSWTVDVELSGHGSATPQFFKNAQQVNELILELIAEDNVSAGCSDLVINVKSACN